jgi:hypothetical protein
VWPRLAHIATVEAEGAPALNPSNRSKRRNMASAKHRAEII